MGRAVMGVDVEEAEETLESEREVVGVGSVIVRCVLCVMCFVFIVRDEADLWSRISTTVKGRQINQQ